MSNETIDTVTKELWDRARTIFIAMLQNAEERAQAERYLGMVSRVAKNGDSLVVLTVNEFAANLLRDQYETSLINCIKLAGGSPDIKLTFAFDESKKPSIIIPVEQAVNRPAAIQRPAVIPNTTYVSTLPLNANYTFEEFVKGPSNSWAYAAAKGVAQHPGEAGYNPLFIHGGTGLGKTHLMQAIGNELRKNKPQTAICYLTAETFLNEYINALQNEGIRSFREKYRNADILLMDDVQFLQKGTQCQEEFFNTFNALKDTGKQIVMTSDVAPKNLPALDERLISRFEGGMVQEIEYPSYETRLAILKKKTEDMHPRIPDSVINFIAEKIRSHVRAMEGALSKVRVTMMMNPGETITNEMLSRLLKDLIEKEKTLRKLTVEEIQSVVAKKYSVSISQILSAERTASLVTPRQMAMYIARKYTTKSLQEIAGLFDKKHATIIHGVRAIETRLDVEPELKATLEEIISEFGLATSDRME